MSARRDLEALAFEHAAGKLGDVERSEIDAHLESDAALRRHFERVGDMMQAVELVAKKGWSPARERRILKSVLRKTRRSTARQSPPDERPVEAAAPPEAAAPRTITPRGTNNTDRMTASGAVLRLARPGESLPPTVSPRPLPPPTPPVEELITQAPAPTSASAEPWKPTLAGWPRAAMLVLLAAIGALTIWLALTAGPPPAPSVRHAVPFDGDLWSTPGADFAVDEHTLTVRSGQVLVEYLPDGQGRLLIATPHGDASVSASIAWVVVRPHSTEFRAIEGALSVTRRGPGPEANGPALVVRQREVYTTTTPGPVLAPARFATQAGTLIDLQAHRRATAPHLPPR